MGCIVRRFALAVLLLSGCARPEPVDNGAIDINAAADRAKGDIETYAANTAVIDAAAAATLPAAVATPSVTKAVPLAPAEPGQPGGLLDDRTPIAEGPFAPDSAQAAADVVQRYYAAIESGRYRQAWALWDDGGRDSGMTSDAFVNSFGRYKEYHANIGAPGDMDAGAGQRYVVVPVQVYARLADGRAEYRLGRVILHRVADIDGANAEQKRWHIRSIDLTPVPGGKARKPVAYGTASARTSRLDLKNGGGPDVISAP